MIKSVYGVKGNRAFKGRSNWMLKNASPPSEPAFPPTEGYPQRYTTKQSLTN